MADDDMEDGLGEDEGSAGGSAPKKGGGFLPSLIKYVALALGAIIIIVTIVIIAVRVVLGDKSQSAPIPISEDYKEIAEELDWYQSLGEIQTRSSDPIPASIVVNVFMGYKKDDKTTSTEITMHRIPIRDFLRRYFAGKTAEELTPTKEEKIMIEIRNEINDTILNKGKIRKISFDKLNVVTQN